MKGSTQFRWALRNGVWTLGATSVADYIRRTADYTLDGVARLIACLTLVLDTCVEASLALRRSAPPRCRLGRAPGL